jgi:hypothetical protein
VSGAVYVASSATGHVTRRSPHHPLGSTADDPRVHSFLALPLPLELELVRSEPATGKADEDKIGSAGTTERGSVGSRLVYLAPRTGEAEAGKVEKQVSSSF